MDDQFINYLLISPSVGHNILSKQAGISAGKMIIEKKEITNQDNTLDYLIGLFDFLKVGLLRVESKTTDRVVLHMDESVYSSGVKNINMKLDTFIVGIIEGALIQSTNHNYQVEETKCLANGDSCCEFTGKIR